VKVCQFGDGIGFGLFVIGLELLGSGMDEGDGNNETFLMSVSAEETKVLSSFSCWRRARTKSGSVLRKMDIVLEEAMRWHTDSTEKRP
jgi:hypothetical protein